MTESLIQSESRRRSRIVVATNNPNEPRSLIQPGTGFDGVVAWGMNGETECSGSLLYTGRHILTVAHCFNNIDDTPNLNPNPNSYTVFFDLPIGRISIPAKRIFVHPNWRSDYDNNSDIAIIELSQPAPIEADRYQIYTEFDEVGKVFEKVGYGVSGTGWEGENFDELSQIKRRGKNRYDAFSEIFNDDPQSNIAPKTQLAYDFDNGSFFNDAFGVEYGIVDLGLGSEEIGISGGDSGAPAFIDGKIAGLSSFGQSPFDPTIDVTDFNDTSFGEFFSDTRVSIYASWIEETIALSNSGDDLIVGSNKIDILNGNQGNDTIEGVGGGDTLFGGRENDLIRGGDGDDFLSGNLGNDFLEGGSGNDQLFGGQADDILNGGEGQDSLSGDRGRDILTGGNGEDLFILSNQTAVNDPLQADVIIDFSLGDRIGLTEGLTTENLTLETVNLDGVSGILIRNSLANTVLGFVQNTSVEQLSGNLISI
ncbi:trypsin-like serine protease [Limnoraphis robusta Tam1]|uniref:Trypsin-like serine protease n=1 Tax=Limnoraphis robusta CCNP1315 TaxID=3110306 RepID=A0ABU5U1C4_9CYAN|nr:trypsin-like serine protease [Limnoraphis robusta]MEA5495691.1 trypsin-like serine protease [Limnoraphis robusta BA-68 BA1]MEA5520985.1 trypsin-like serine protease [Limnoraphis robusta CCNP1315]MEA5540128.1 trypsin-like serine protease [Limnoraphis robusta Tam1]MEA5543569.1 trypsin-like serine protease [Limnoraphis robusta CCNP1324]